jgi:23S rRNA pseudouridine1911/1915/1917 synthase
MNEPHQIENYPRHIETIHEIKLTSKQVPIRIDVYLTNQIMYATRSKVRQAIDEGRVLINGKKVKPSQKIKPNDRIKFIMLKPPPVQLVPENIELKIAYEDDDLLVVNKPPNMVVHPSFGHRKGTLINALLYHFGQRESIDLEFDDEEDDDENINEGSIFASDAIRPGIVHRLDKDTSGILVVAKNSFTHSELSKQFFERTTDREYNAIVWGVLKKDKGIVDSNLARSTRDRKIFQTVSKGGKTAKTTYEVIKRYSFATLIKLKLYTGRTHQIRVHCKSINHPVIGDEAYGGDKLFAGAGVSEIKKEAEKVLTMATRQMLHAKTLSFDHPKTGERLSFSSEIPEDMSEILSFLDELNQKLSIF